MAFRVDFTELAAEDLESISKFIAEDNPAAAARVCRGLYLFRPHPLSAAQWQHVFALEPRRNGPQFGESIHDRICRARSFVLNPPAPAFITFVERVQGGSSQKCCYADAHSNGAGHDKNLRAEYFGASFLSATDS